MGRTRESGLYLWFEREKHVFSSPDRLRSRQYRQAVAQDNVEKTAEELQGAASQNKDVENGMEIGNVLEHIEDAADRVAHTTRDQEPKTSGWQKRVERGDKPHNRPTEQ